MLSSYRDYILIVFGILFSLLTAILAAALVNVFRIYFEEYLTMVIVLCVVAISVLIKLFKRIIGLKLLEETLDAHNLDMIQVRFEKEIKRIHSDVRKIFHISTVKGKIIYNILLTPLALLYFFALFFIALFFTYLFIKFQEIMNFHQLPEETVLVIFSGTIILLIYKTSPLINQVGALLAKPFKHIVEFAWNWGPFLNPKECHVIFDSHNDTVLIRFLSEEEYLSIEKMIRDLGLEYADDTAIFYR